MIDERIPGFLAPFERELEKYKREAIIITAIPFKDKILNDPLRIDESKFLGLPYLPKDKDYPIDQSGMPMILLAQLNFSDIPPIKNYPKDGVLMIFISPSNWYENECKIIYANRNIDHRTEFECLDEKLYEDCPIYCVHRLEFKRIVDNGGSEDVNFDIQFNGLSYWDFEESLSENETEKLAEYFNADGHKIGGYCGFTQSDPRDYERIKRNDIQILQIDTDENVMFGDSGIAHVFINKADLVNKNFENAYFYWDCC